jgi:hypothetical protein
LGFLPPNCVGKSEAEASPLPPPTYHARDLRRNAAARARGLAMTTANPPRVLHGAHAARRLARSLLPPMATGMTWSACVAHP